MSKKKSFVLHTEEGEQVVVTLGGFDYCIGNDVNGSAICLMGETINVIESPSTISRMLNELED